MDRGLPSLLTTWKEISPLRSSITAGFSGKGTAGLEGGGGGGCASESEVALPLVADGSSG